MYLNQWTNYKKWASYSSYYFYLHDKETHENNLDVNTLIGIYEK